MQGVTQLSSSYAVLSCVLPRADAKCKDAHLDVVQDVGKPGMHPESMHPERLKHILPMQQSVHDFWILPQP